MLAQAHDFDGDGAIPNNYIILLLGLAVLLVLVWWLVRKGKH